MTRYKITAAHSGTDTKEIEKAKRHFRKILNAGDTWNQVTSQINIQFNDINYEITASFFNEAGQEVCNPLLILSSK